MQNTTDIQARIESSFRAQVQKDNKVKNAYLLVYSEKLGVDLNLAEGMTDDIKANTQQPNHLASVGKLFTATIISILYERKQLDFTDPIAKSCSGTKQELLSFYAAGTKGPESSEQLVEKSGRHWWPYE